MLPLPKSALTWRNVSAFGGAYLRMVDERLAPRERQFLAYYVECRDVAQEDRERVLLAAVARVLLRAGASPIWDAIWDEARDALGLAWHEPLGGSTAPAPPCRVLTEATAAAQQAWAGQDDTEGPDAPVRP